MYRILIKTIRHTNVETISWYSDAATGKVWETSAIDLALDEYKKLLDKYPAGSLTLAEVIPINIFVDDTPQIDASNGNSAGGDAGATSTDDGDDDTGTASDTNDNSTNSQS